MWLGFEIKVIKEYKFLIVDENGELRWVEVWKFKEGNWVGVVRRLLSLNVKVLILDLLFLNVYFKFKGEFLRELKFLI